MEKKAFSSRPTSLFLMFTLALSLIEVGCDTYWCPDPNGHCYATVIRKEAVNGCVVKMTATSLNAGTPLSSNNYEVQITDEMWMIQEGNPACSTNGAVGVCWIEVGLYAGYNIVNAPPSETHFFWADSRPNSVFYFHDLGKVPGADFGQPVQLLIWQTAYLPASPNDFYAVVTDSTKNYVGVSQNNLMAANKVIMGTELVGSQAASAPKADFWDMHSGTALPLPQDTSNGTIRQDSPPYITVSFNSSGRVPINFSTSCCTNGP
jgi:hypothetical protein